MVWRNPRVVLRTPARCPIPSSRSRSRASASPGPILKTFPLREMLPPSEVARLRVRREPRRHPGRPKRFRGHGAAPFEINVDHESYLAELHTDVELGADRDAVIRVMVSNRPDGVGAHGRPAGLRGRHEERGLPDVPGRHRRVRRLLPPNSHGEANPADKDPVPAPFDNTYNSPEHDAFVIKVKYQRTDEFFTQNLVDGEEARGSIAPGTTCSGRGPTTTPTWACSSTTTAWLPASRRIEDMTPARMAALPEDGAAARAPAEGALRRRSCPRIRRGEAGHVADALAFASRAWRRPLTPAEEANLRAFYRRVAHRPRPGPRRRRARARGPRPHVARVPLSSGDGTRRRGDGPRRLGAGQPPELLPVVLAFPTTSCAAPPRPGELGDPSKLAGQVRRMTADPKARRLATEFFGQWLGFYHFDQYRGVDTGRFPEFTDEVKTSMYEQSVATFEYLVREGRPVKEILHADYTFLNPALAKFYGVDAKLAAPNGQMEKVDGASAFDRGGALRLGSVLTTTSAPLRTSPVKRGDWILRRILSTPTPPPPADAGTLPADDKSFEGQTLRQRLASHKREARCATCHLRIDPWASRSRASTPSDAAARPTPTASPWT